MNFPESNGVPLWRWLVWMLYIAAWTTALLVPIPDNTPFDNANLTIDLKYIFAKSVHVSAYALLAAMTGWLRVPTRKRWLLMFFIMAHGTLTELLQLATENRSGCLADVGFDNAGIAIGMLLTWNWWSAADRPDHSPVETRVRSLIEDQ